MTKLILFIVRIDARTKNGGDLIQAEIYKQYLERHLDVEVSFAHMLPISELKAVLWDYVQLFNYSRIPEHSFYLNKIGYKKIGLCTIIQPGYQISKNCLFKSFIRGALNFKLLNPFRVDIDRVISSMDLIVYLSKSEKEFFESLHMKISQDVIVNNGIDIFKKTKNLNKKYDFIVVGRIERWKNSIRSLKYVAKNHPDKKLIFVGSYNKLHYLFYLQFLFLIFVNKNIRYLGAKSKDNTLLLISQSKILLNLSLKEVSPLVDLEAISCETNLVTTTRSFSHLVNDGNVVLIEPNDDIALDKAINFFRVQQKVSMKQAQSWSKCIGTYVQAVEALLV